MPLTDMAPVRRGVGRGIDAARVRRFIEQQQASIRMFSELMNKPEEEPAAAPAAP